MNDAPTIGFKAPNPPPLKLTWYWYGVVPPFTFTVNTASGEVLQSKFLVKTV